MSNFGLINLHKPAGMTSRKAVDVVQRAVRPAKAGHAGTLDPLATGVLVCCVGPATRLIEYVQQMPKSYTGTFLLGRSSPTEDIEGEVTELVEPPIPGRDEIVAASQTLVGEIQQQPPIFSALKVDGRRAHKLARQGIPVELKPRPVTVHRIEVVAYEYPELTLEVECGSGTYIRSLGRDLAESLSTAAVMSALVRTAIGPFHLDDAVFPKDINRHTLTEHLLPAARAVGSMPQLVLSDEEAVEIGHGRRIDRDIEAPDDTQWAALDASGRLVAILIRREHGRLSPVRTFPAGS